MSSIIFKEGLRSHGLKTLSRGVLSTRSFHLSAIRCSETTSEVVKPTPETATETTPKKHDPSSIDYLHAKGLIHTPIQQALLGLGFTNFTPVQTKSIEPILSTDKDLIVKAKTGTGKTLAFGIPLIKQALHKPTKARGVVSLVIAPTRDLAFQIRDELNKVLRHRAVIDHHKNSVYVQTLVGGENRFHQKKAFDRHPIPSIVVATPGRFLDLIQEPRVREAFTQLDTLVLDEADRLLGDGFKEDLVRISRLLKKLNTDESKELKTLLYSATLDKSIVQFSSEILRNGTVQIDTVDPNEPETHEKINQSLIMTQNIFESFVAAIKFIESENKTNKNFKAIVFLPTVKAVSYFYDILRQYNNDKGINLYVNQLHGQLSQAVRDRSVKNFRNGSNDVLVASDVGARGMDFPRVTNVIQVGLPMDSTNYVHRVGRTARGGQTGKAVMILSRGESRFLRVLKNRNVTISEQFQYEPLEDLERTVTDLSLTARHKFDIDQVTESLAGFTKSVSGSYRLDMYTMLEEISTSYGKFVDDLEAKPKVSPNFAQKVLGLRRRDAEEFFDFSPRENNDQGFGGRGGLSRPSRREQGFDSDRPPRRDFNRERSPRREFSNDRTQRRSFDRNDNYRRNNSNDNYRRFDRDGDDDAAPRQRRNFNEDVERPQRRKFNDDGEFQPKKFGGRKFD